VVDELYGPPTISAIFIARRPRPAVGRAREPAPQGPEPSGEALRARVVEIGVAPDAHVDAAGREPLELRAAAVSEVSSAPDDSDSSSRAPVLPAPRPRGSAGSRKA
jgi:hypothetical protein